MLTKKAKHIKQGDKIRVVTGHDSDGEPIEGFCEVVAISHLESGNGTLLKSFLVDFNDNRFWTIGFHPQQYLSYDNQKI